MQTEQLINSTIYSFVHTYNQDGKITDTRVIDMSNNGARKWLMNHHWWALNNSCMVGLTLATRMDFEEHQKARLVQRFNKKPSHEGLLQAAG